MELNLERRGSGEPLLLVHGLGAGWRSWEPVLDDLAAEREVTAVDLPGFGSSAPLAGEVSVAAFADSVAEFVERQGLGRVAMAGHSMGARIVLELARRGVGGDVVALDPGGFWNDRELAWFAATLQPSVALVRMLRRALPTLVATAAGRTALLAQLAARPASLDPETVLPDLQGLAACPGVRPALHALVHGPRQTGAPSGTTPGRVTLGWGRRDLVTLPSQALRAAALYPDAELHWFERCGHFPQWDCPAEAAQLILEGTVQ